MHKEKYSSIFVDVRKCIALWVNILHQSISELSSTKLINLGIGVILMSFEHRFLIYDRVNMSVNSLIKTWTTSLRKFKTISTVSLLGKSQPGYGDYFVCLEANG